MRLRLDSGAHVLLEVIVEATRMREVIFKQHTVHN